MPPRRRSATSTSNFGVGRRESHVADAFYARFEAPELSADEHVTPHEPGISCVCGDARRMDAVADDSVALVVTSPPYFAGKQYEEELDREGVPGSYIEYLALLRDVFADCKRVLEPGGRIAVNVANLGRKPYRSLAADVMAILQDDLHLLPRGEIVWQKGEGASGSCAWGSFRSAANPVLRDVTERVIVASKGRFGRARSPKERRRDGLPHESSIGADDFMALDARRVGHPAGERAARAAPRAVPRRAAAAADGALHVSRRSGGGPVLRVGLDAGGGGPVRARRRRLRPRPGLRRAGPGPAGRRGGAPDRDRRRRRRVGDGAGPVRPRGRRLRRRAAQPPPARARPGGRLHGGRRRRADLVLRRGGAQLGLPRRHGPLGDRVARPRPGPRDGRPRASPPSSCSPRSSPGRAPRPTGPCGRPGRAGSSTRSTSWPPTPGRGSPAYAAGRTARPAAGLLGGRRRGAGRRV